MINVALIGLGNISYHFDSNITTKTILSHIKALYLDNRFCLKYCVDIDDKNQTKIKQIFPTIEFYTQIDYLIEKTDIDIVIIATPTSTHFEILETLKMNDNIKYFFVEKPLFEKSDYFDSLEQSLKNKIIINYIRLFEPNIQNLHHQIQNQTYKEIQKIVLTYTKGIKNNGSHFISLINFLFDNPEIENIQILATKKGLHNDPTLDIVAFINYQNKKIPFYMVGLDYTKYSTFDIDFYFENSKIRIEDTSQTIFISSVQQDETYPDYTTLKTSKSIKLNFDIIMKFPYDYLYELYTHNNHHIDFIEHEKCNNNFYQNLKKGKKLWEN